MTIFQEKEAESDQETYHVEEHHACWDLEKRGAMGETPLHLLYLSKEIEVAKILLDIYPKMAPDFYEGPEYYGEWSSGYETFFYETNGVILKCLLFQRKPGPFPHAN